MPRFNWVSFLLGHALIALLFGAAIAVLVLGLNLIVAVIWFGMLVRTAGSREGSRAVAGVLTQLCVMILVITVAASAPVKTTDRFLEQAIEVPSTVMALLEIGGGADELQPEWLPVSVRFRVPQDEKSKQIAFPATTMTIREFVDAIESQSTLRHRFGHCGNGSTILWGGDCSFGLHLRRPTD